METREQTSQVHAPPHKETAHLHWEQMLIEVAARGTSVPSSGGLTSRSPVSSCMPTFNSDPLHAVTDIMCWPFNQGSRMQQSQTS